VRLEIFPGFSLQIESLVCFSCNFEKSYKFIEKSKNCKHNFVVLYLTRTAISAKDVYTFEH
jgi:hypothetical protein